jgi:RNA polymerase sigma factor (sigma-70 family)
VTPHGPGDNGVGLPAGSEQAPEVTPAVSAVSRSFGVNGLPESESAAFRISRTPADDTPLEVHYTLTAYTSTGAIGHEQAATIAPGASHVDVPAILEPSADAADHEVVTLTLRDNGGYSIARPSATLFVAGESAGCSETALFEAYKRGQSQEAFNALVERHRPTVFRTCYGILGNRADAEDVSQVVFMMLAGRGVRLHATLAGWLRTVARNASIAFLRSRRRRARHELLAAKLAVAVAEDAVTALREELDLALRQLPPSLREAVRLRYLEDWSQKEAAQILGCPRGTLSQRAARGLRCLRNILAARDNS